MPKIRRSARATLGKAAEISRANEAVDTLPRDLAMCSDCGGTTFIDAELKTYDSPLSVETIFHKWFQRNSSGVICKVCAHCGRIRLYAEDLSKILRALQ